MDAYLLVVGGDVRANDQTLQLPSTIGRGREATITITHPMISRIHCEIFEEEGWLLVRDRGSLNGTFVNNRRILGEYRLAAGDLLCVGAVTFKVVYDEPLDDPYPLGKSAEKEGLGSTIEFASTSTLNNTPNEDVEKDEDKPAANKLSRDVSSESRSSDKN